ncbi:bicarbonate transport system permease protein CmpB [Antarctobacter heliothermus]|uniref:Bicarbonate transport system permease protein CmpB n=1 Tax=Antarctobacter heliothermus TaxID=74033 RepID=A0A222E6Q1_9RHOB|nr:ABC transporter permease subunit [Antarctobacter heliothermus]ASP21800.1 bicarbonate transport system permease protein CmpB [Antarctobacter heliothermus]MBT55962.1 nitrate ABC transporter permease [Mameliella sp.]|tara:strand:+ start:10128 stop:10880 length:753 start_codon:yes stop_codon:yes gene_type:complete
MKRATTIRILVLLGAVLFVELLCRIGVIVRFTMIPPSEMVVGLFNLLVSGKMNDDMTTTLSSVAISLVASVIVGTAAGAIIHALPRVRRTIDPLLATYYSVPVFVFYPMFIVLFGLNDVPKIVIGFLYAVVAVIINTLNGLDRIPPVLVKTGLVYGMSRVSIVMRILLPFAAPYLFTGVKLAIAYSFIGIIGAEFILSANGLGHSISYAYHNFDNVAMYSLILFILIVVLTINMSLHAWEKMLMKRRGFQ